MTAAAEIGTIPLFKGLSEEQLRTVGAVLRRARAAEGEEILTEGDPGRSLFALVSGTVETTKHLGVIGLDGATPRQKILVKLSAPQFFGEIGLLEDTPRSATVRAATACELLELRRDDFERLVAADVQLGYLLMRNVASALIARLRSSDRDILKLTAALSIALGNR